jgi:hypothetical protein
MGKCNFRGNYEKGRRKREKMLKEKRKKEKSNIKI